MFATYIKMNLKKLLFFAGSYGRPLDLLSNYFAVETTPQWRLYQYRVDISPDEDSTVVRKGLLRIHSKTLGG